MYMFCFQYIFFNSPASTMIYTLSLHDALPIYLGQAERLPYRNEEAVRHAGGALERHEHDLPRQRWPAFRAGVRSEEHTSELQSRLHLVCRLLLEKKKKKNIKQENNIKY